MGITGSDLVAEQGVEVQTRLKLGVGKCRLAICVPEDAAINSVTDLKIKLLETIATVLAVVFLKAVLSVPVGTPFQWEELVLPIAVALFAATTWIIRRAH